MRYIKSISNWPDPGVQRCDMRQIIHRKTENNKGTQICLKYILSISPVSTLVIYVKTISTWPGPGGQRGGMSQNYLL